MSHLRSASGLQNPPISGPTVVSSPPTVTSFDGRILCRRCGQRGHIQKDCQLARQETAKNLATATEKGDLMTFSSDEEELREYGFAVHNHKVRERQKRLGLDEASAWVSGRSKKREVEPAASMQVPHRSRQPFTSTHDSTGSQHRIPSEPAFIRAQREEQSKWTRSSAPQQVINQQSGRSASHENWQQAATIFYPTTKPPIPDLL